MDSNKSLIGQITCVIAYFNSYFHSCLSFYECMINLNSIQWSNALSFIFHTRLQAPQGEDCFLIHNHKNHTEYSVRRHTLVISIPLNNAMSLAFYIHRQGNRSQKITLCSKPMGQSRLFFSKHLYLLQSPSHCGQWLNAIFQSQHYRHLGRRSLSCGRLSWALQDV